MIHAVLRTSCVTCPDRYSSELSCSCSMRARPVKSSFQAVNTIFFPRHSCCTGEGVLLLGLATVEFHIDLGLNLYALIQFPCLSFCSTRAVLSKRNVRASFWPPCLSQPSFSSHLHDRNQPCRSATIHLCLAGGRKESGGSTTGR